ncbi:MAG: Hsp70 family protein, partial [Myxococcota bacterium]
LPARRADTFYTVAPGQSQIEVEVFQGENDDARLNTLLGRFMVDDLDRNAPDHSPIRFELGLDLDGILTVSVTEVATGLNKQVRIQDAFRKLSSDELIDARSRLLDFFGEEGQDWDFRHSTIAAGHTLIDVAPASKGDSDAPNLTPPSDLTAPERQQWTKATEVLNQAQSLIAAGDLPEADLEELNELSDQLLEALGDADLDLIQEHTAVLTDVLFYLE